MIVIPASAAKKADRTSYLAGDFEANGARRPLTPVIFGPTPVEVQNLAFEISSFENRRFEYILSWSEPYEEVGATNVQEMRSSAFRLFCGPLPPEDFLHTGVGHLRRASGTGFDSHDVLNTTHLPTGCEFPFFCNTKLDGRLLRTFELLHNYERGWSDKGDRFRHNLQQSPPRDMSPECREVFTRFDVEVAQWVRTGFVSCRDDAVARLRDGGMKVTSDNDSITLFYEAKEIRFRGGKYRRDFDYGCYAQNQEEAYDERECQLPGLREEFAVLQKERDRRISRRFAGRTFAFPEPTKTGDVELDRYFFGFKEGEFAEMASAAESATAPGVELGVQNYLRDESGVASISCDNARSNWDFEGMGGNWQRGESRRNASLGDKNQRSPSSAKSCGEQGEISSPDKRSRASDWDRETDGRNQGEPTTGVVQGARQGRTVDLPLLFRTGFAGGEIKNERDQPERQQNSISYEAGLRSTFGVISRRFGSAFFGDTEGDSGVEAANYEPSATAIRAGDGRVFPMPSVVSELSRISGAEAPDGLDRTLDLANAALLDASVERLGKAIETFEGEIGLQARPPLPIPRPALDYDLSR